MSKIYMPDEAAYVEPEDDGRTVADMSGVESQSVLSGLFWFRTPPEDGKNRSGSPWERSGRDPAQDPSLGGQELSGPSISPEERRMWMFGAIRAALLTALVYIGALGGVIALMVLLWRH